MKKAKTILVFVHGWSVTNTDTYGQLPQRLKSEAIAAGLEVEIEEIFLGRYVSFHDEVRLPDISRAFEAAVNEQLAGLLNNNKRFVCITHSTGGPVVRDWWARYYPHQKSCPMSHLIMLAPANYGSALAQLGKGRLSRMKFWFGGVEPGQGVLDWLELGSEEAWQLNSNWIKSGAQLIDKHGVFPFVLTGQSIDRNYYDHLNTYTGESGSDGVVRVAAANLQATYLQLVQQIAEANPDIKNQKALPWIAPKLNSLKFFDAPETVLRILQGKSHSGKNKGVMRSVKKSSSDQKSQQTIDAILECIKVNTKLQYQQLISDFKKENNKVQAIEKLEVVKNLLLSDSRYIHDRYSMVIFKVNDHQGHPINDFDLILTAGKNSDPNHLPAGFFVDKQRNKKHPNIITFYFNYDLMTGTAEVVDDNGKIIREAKRGISQLGLKIIPRPAQGFVHYLSCEINASQKLLAKILQPNSTSLIDICLQRLVFKNVMRLDKGTKTSSFIKVKAEGGIVD